MVIASRWSSREAPARQLTTALALAGLSGLALGCPSDDDESDAEPDPGEIDAEQEPAADAEPEVMPEVEVEEVATGLEHPWGLAFISEEEALVTERPGRLNRLDVESGELEEIGGLPAISAQGQGGLLDVALHPEFDENGWVYLSYAADPGPATHLGRGRLEEGALEDFEVLHDATAEGISGGRHFGARIVFDEDGYLFYTTGDRGDRDRAQVNSNAVGTTLRLEDDGEVPEDNPFVGEDDVDPAIYSYGHRNIQGMTVHPNTGEIWQNEHGPSGGDEINKPEAGENFGWPLTSYGVEYGDGSEIGPDPHDHEDTVPPVYYWGAGDSFAPSGMAFYDGDAFPDWRGDLFVGSLVTEHLHRFSVENDDVQSEEELLADRGWRIRAVTVGPDELLYVLVDASSAPVARLAPAEE